MQPRGNHPKPRRCHLQGLRARGPCTAPALGRGRGWAPSCDQEGRREGALLPPHTQSLSRIYRVTFGSPKSSGAVQNSLRASSIPGRTLTASRRATVTEAAGTQTRAGRLGGWAGELEDCGCTVGGCQPRSGGPAGSLAAHHPSGSCRRRASLSPPR